MRMLGARVSGLCRMNVWAVSNTHATMREPPSPGGTAHSSAACQCSPFLMGLLESATLAAGVLSYYSCPSSPGCPTRPITPFAFVLTRPASSTATNNYLTRGPGAVCSGLGSNPRLILSMASNVNLSHHDPAVPLWGPGTGFIIPSSPVQRITLNSFGIRSSVSYKLRLAGASFLHP
jgi:hypothetical protein